MTDVPTGTLGYGLQVSALGYGAMGLAGVYGPAGKRDALAVLNHAVDAGVTFIDTADMYGAGSNERLIGRLLAERRAEVTVVARVVGARSDNPDPDWVSDTRETAPAPQTEDRS